MKISPTVNGTARADEVEDRTLLVHYLRETCGLPATNIGCDTTSCGACTVLLDGESVKSCTVLAAQADGREVTTVEGLRGTDGRMHPVQEAFRQEHGLQCGFCTPGMVMASVSLLRDHPSPTEQQVREGLEGNFCRCTGYHNIVRAVLAAAQDGGDGMIPAPFTYARAESAQHALDLLAEHGDEAKVLAGGQSLLPILKLRLARPEVLVDVSGVRELSYVRVEGDEIAIGAATRHRDVIDSADLRRDAPLLPLVTAHVGDRQIRHRGTLGGSLVHGDPAADLPAAVLAMDATLVVTGPRGERRVPASAFFSSYFTTDVGEDELLTEVRVPRMPGVGCAYEKFTRRANDWAIVGVAAVDGRVGLVNMGETPLRATAVEQALASGASVADAAALAAEGTSPVEDMHADVAFRQHLARVLTERAVTAARS